MLYALVMDEIAKEIQKAKLGVEIPNSEKPIGCLLWMDDVVLMHENPIKLQEMLDITDKIAKKYHLTFGEEKSKLMTIGTATNHILNVGKMKLEQTNTYKYLGEIITDNKNLDKHINDAKRKAEAAYHTILTIAADPQLRGIQMETIWRLVETCIIPIITYGAEKHGH